MSLAFNAGNQLETYGNEKLKCDANGNRTADGKYSYTWNEADQLTTITKQGETTPFAKSVDPGDEDDPVTQNGYTYADGHFAQFLIPVAIHGARYAAKKSAKYTYRYARGRAFEKKALRELGLKKNTKRINGTIPDSLSKGRITEIKDVRRVSMSKQFRRYVKTGKRIDLVVSKHSRVSKPLQAAIKKSGGKIKVRYGKNRYYTHK
nr:putative toxin [Bacillus sp. FDAARGOS_235]